jgi:hypothetical protein
MRRHGVTSQNFAPAEVFVTVTLNEQLAVFPAESVAVETTVVVPSGNEEPEGGLLTTVTEPQLSVAVTLNVTIAELPDVVTFMLDGQLITGPVLSATTTLKEHEADPFVFVAVAVTEVVPTGKKLPEVGE